jgi:ABC-type multidrug transport system fused ATPase/permease subunit
MFATVRKILAILTPRARRAILPLLALILAATVFESASVGIVIPVLRVLIDPEWIAEQPRVLSVVRYLNITGQRELAVWAMGSMVTLHVIKTCLAIALAYAESRFAYATQAHLSSRMFALYLERPWTFHLQRDSSQIVRNATTEPRNVAALLTGTLYICSESFVVAALATVLFVAEPVGALVSLVTISCAAGLFQWLIHGRFQRWGARRQQLEAEQLRYLNEGLGAAKEVKLSGRESFFKRAFTTRNRRLTVTLQREQFVGQLPRLWLESVAIIGIAALVTVLVYRDQSFSDALPTLGLFAAAAFRLLPSFNRLMGAYHLVQFRLPSLDIIHSELASVPTQSPSASEKGQLEVSDIELRDVTFRYPDYPRDVLGGVSARIEAGMTVGFIGPSGTGKSTLVDVILGLLPATTGTVMVNGNDIRESLRDWQRSVGYVPQSIYLMDDTIRRNVAFGLDDPDINDEQVWRALERASLGDFVRCLPAALDTVTGERGVRLSGGQRQRIGIARALFNDPDVLVLDEATSALDGVTEEEVMGAVRALHGQKTILIVAHRLSTIAHCDAVYRLYEGRLTQAHT